MSAETITIDKTYEYCSAFRDDEALRKSFNELTQECFGFNLENWYRTGLWTDSYCPCSIVDDGRVVANVSINTIDFIIDGSQRRFIQLGTVMTAKDYRMRGLNRYLLTRVINEQKNNCDLLYLFANCSVLDFYPRFGFIPVPEYRHSKAISVRTLTPNIIKLNMSDKGQRDMFAAAVKTSLHFSPLSMIENAPLVIFYCLNGTLGSVYYLRQFEAFVVADLDDETMYLNGIYCRTPVSIDDIIASIANTIITRVVLGFTPDNNRNFECDPLDSGDSRLFILGETPTPLKSQNAMFPLLSHA